MIVVPYVPNDPTLTTMPGGDRANAVSERRADADAVPPDRGVARRLGLAI